MSWLDLVLCRFVPFCLAVMINSKHCLLLGDPTIYCVFMKIGKESTLTDYHSFRFIWKGFPFKMLFILLSFLSLSPHKYQKSLSKTTLMSLNRKIMDQTMSTIIDVTWSKLFGARLEWYQQEVCKKFTPRDQMSSDKLYRSRYSEQLKINRCWLLIVPFPCSWSK